MFLALCGAIAGAGSPALAQQTPPVAAAPVGTAAPALPFAFDGPPPPELPASVARDSEGRTTVRAIRLMAPLVVDGVLDEALYSTVSPVSDFIQVEPTPGAPATEKTEVWISFDRDNVYVSVRATESMPERMVVNEMRRDSNNVWQNESFGVALDTYYDRRNSSNFYFNAIGGRADGQVTNEGQWNADWNPVWGFKVRRDANGWTGEMAIPFKSLRYRPGSAQIWGVQFRRINRWKNELSYLTRLPDGLGLNGIFRVSRGATLVGIEAPAGSRALDVKPYVTSDLTTDRTATPALHNHVGKDFGLDVKYGITTNLTADFTYNTDFAQVEADEQQVNLTRFSLFFPEKREFFLENQGLFNFGGVAGNSAGDTPVLFYSRRIGLDQGHQIPIQAGGRLTGRSGRMSLGVLNIETDRVAGFGVPSTNFSVMRVKRDILRRSAVGGLFTRRSSTAAAGGRAAETYGVDATFAFFANLSINTYWARTHTPGRTTDDTSYRGQFTYNGDRYGAELSHLKVGDDFLPEVGFVRRPDMRRSFANLRFSPRPRRRGRVRKYGYEGSLTYIEDGDGHLETREGRLEFRTEFQNSDSLEFSYTDGYEFVPAPFRIASGVTIPVGGYGLNTARAQFTLGQQRFASGTVYVEHGAFYDGDRTAYGYSGARVKFSAHLAVEPGISVNHVSLPFGSFTTSLVSSRVTYTITPMMFVSSLVQYNSSSHAFSTNARLRWEYRPGSELFVVYNDVRDTSLRGFPDLQTRALVVKVNRLLRF